MSEDVYDVGQAKWCYLCEAPHFPCEPADLTFECVSCQAPLPDGTEYAVDLECSDCKPPNTGGE